jgi:hypothetical protein
MNRQKQNLVCKLGVVVPAYIPSTQEDETGESRVQGQTGLHREFLSQTNPALKDAEFLITQAKFQQKEREKGQKPQGSGGNRTSGRKEMSWPPVSRAPGRCMPGPGLRLSLAFYAAISDAAQRQS